MPFKAKSRPIIIKIKNLKKIKAIRLTRNKHYRKLKTSIRNTFYWLINADVLNFTAFLSYLSRPEK
jgi:hypothetical protein